MLKPFQIRDLGCQPDQSPSVEPSSPALSVVDQTDDVHHHQSDDEPRSSPRVVQISAGDYNALSRNNPRARLTYVDLDDGDTITVGSALELSQRLDEPIASSIQNESLQALSSQHDPTPMHIFDIRRSNSVTELWKKFESNTDSQGCKDKPLPECTADDKDPGKVSTAEDAQPPLLAAFEAELATILHSAESAETQPPRSASPPVVEPSAAQDSEQNTSRPIEVLAARILHHLVHGAGMVQSELRTRLPEMQRQFHSAQSTLPENVRTSLQQLLTSLENQMRNLGAHLNHLPDDGRHLAGEALNVGRPIAENAVDTLRQVASELNEVSRSLFAAFEHEVRRAGMNRPDSSADGLYTAPAPQPTNNQPSSSGQNGEQPPTGSTGNEQQASESTTKEESNPTSAPSGPTSQPLPYRPPGACAPPIWPPPRHRPFFYPPPPPLPPQLPQWPFQWPPGPPHHWFRPGRQDPPNPNPAPPFNPNLRNAHTQTGPHTSKSLFIGNVGFNVTERMIQDVFASKGFIVDVDLPVDATSGKHCGFGYLHFPSIHPAMAAMQALQGTHIDGHAINLEFSDRSPIENFSAPPSPAGIPTQSPNVSRRESVNNNRNTELAERRPSRSSASSEVPSARRARTGLPVRRKSVTFQEPSPSTTKSDQTAALLDSPTDDPAFAARFPSLLPQGNPQGQDSTGPDNLSSLNPEREMARFPPVSQLEAHLLANQRQDKDAEKDKSQSSDKGKGVVQPTIHKGPSHEAPEALRGSQSHHDTSIGNGHGLRRANTTISAHSNLTPGGPPIAPLRRRATERQSLRPNARPASEMDTWARLDRRERIRPTPTERIPGSFPEEETAEVSGQTHDPIESCITTLLDLGYGTEQNGGRSRMAVYAAAADGDLLEAIEIIEDERKAYVRRGSQ
ncbi:hypothetical protein N7474_009861 [Penicillium riverlandense]|uniref:uncharacterized protein n=1 Tax=Penicillium riverlandense TaxID=1903569 RepID=UPI0025485759|nr:uncharacterized protein N7474_009861 [Penicillium riverlandense]KAJ5808592.1 hypothetical protein N7474_009861 [Penicillium riverlandense]